MPSNKAKTESAYLSCSGHPKRDETWHVRPNVDRTKVLVKLGVESLKVLHQRGEVDFPLVRDNLLFDFLHGRLHCWFQW